MNFLDIGDISPEIVWKAQKDPEVRECMGKLCMLAKLGNFLMQ